MTLQQKKRSPEFPGGPVVRTPCFDCGGMGSIPGQGTKIPHATWHGQKQTKKRTKERKKRKEKEANKIIESKVAQEDTKPNYEVRKLFFNNY